MAKFKVTDHKMVPDHILLTSKEEKEICKKYCITKDHLPKIRQSDPCIRSLEARGEPIIPGRVLKIVRRSETAGVAIAYRVVIEG